MLKRAVPLALLAVTGVSLLRVSFAALERQDRWSELFNILQEVKLQRDKAVREAWKAEQEAWRAKQMLLSLGAPATPVLQHAEGETVHAEGEAVVAYSPDGRKIASGG
ncbi:MAG: hypothetical protein ACK53L_07400, partial [Pirellulaceae bacterium]